MASLFLDNSFSFFDFMQSNKSQWFFYSVLFNGCGVNEHRIFLMHGQFINLTRFLSNEYGMNKSLLGLLLVGASFIVYILPMLN